MCRTDVIPDHVYIYYNKNDDIVETIESFPDVKEKYIDGMDETVADMNKNNDYSPDMKNILNNRFKILKEKYSDWKKDKQQIKQEGGYQGLYVINKNKYMELH